MRWTCRMLGVPVLALLAGVSGCASSGVESELRAERDRYALDLADAQKAQRDSQATIARLRDDLQAMQVQRDDARKTVDDVTRQLEVAKAASAQKDQQLADAKGLQSQVDSLRTDKASLERQLRETEARLVDALDRLRLAESQLKASRGATTLPGTRPVIDMNK